MSIAISIINYNSKDLLDKLLKNLESEKIPDSEIWVLDNNSPDDFKKTVKKDFPKVNFIQSEKNGGFAKGHNIVLRKLNVGYVLILNPDTEVPKGSIQKMVEFMDQNPQCGISSCKIVGYDNSLHSNGGNYPFGISLLVWLFNLEMFPGIGNSLPNFHRTDRAYYSKPKKVDWVGGTFMIARIDALKKINYFNEKYFMYFEDVDLCYRMNKAGFDIMINPDVTIKHKSGGSTNDPRFHQFKGEMTGLMIFFASNGNLFEKTIIKPLTFLSVIFRIIAFSAIGKFNIAKTYMRVIGSI